MTAITSAAPGVGFSVAAMCLLVLRRPGPGALGLVILAGTLAVLGPHGTSAARLPAWVVLAAGLVAVLAVRGAFHGLPGPAVSVWAVGASMVAAVAEEAVFRRTLYAHLERWGPAVAVAVPAVLFGLVHVPAYGWGVLLVNVGAGVLFGWQRWASGGWSASAATHAAANLVQMG